MNAYARMSANVARPLEWKPRALRELLESFEFIAADNPRAARRVIDDIRAAATELSSQPFIGRKGRVRGTREFPIPRTPYLLIYRIRPGKVVIGRVLHHARRYP